MDSVLHKLINDEPIEDVENGRVVVVINSVGHQIKVENGNIGSPEVTNPTTAKKINSNGGGKRK